jgi:hypothetical protein
VRWRPLAEWRARRLPGLSKDGLRVGLNWSGNRATGDDLEPSDVALSLSSRESVYPGKAPPHIGQVRPDCGWSAGVRV